MLRTGLPLLVVAFFSSQAIAQDVSFEKAVLPIFQAKCLNCHGEKRQKAGLDLRTKAAILKGGESGHVLKPGSLKDSLLWEKIRTDEMPEGKVKLTAAEKDVIHRWIEAGAPGDDKAIAPSIDRQVTDEDRKFWAFQTPVRPKVPASNLSNPIDAFILDALQKKNLSPSPQADRLTLLRRVTFDLTGLPPSLHFPRKPEPTLPALSGVSTGNGFFAGWCRWLQLAEIRSLCIRGVTRYVGPHAKDDASHHPTDSRCGRSTPSAVCSRPTTRSACATTV